MQTNDIVIERPSDLTAHWLAATLGVPVTGFTVDRIGTGQMSECYRVGLTYDDGAAGPASVVLKVAATDPTSRQTGLALGLYEREVKFYSDVAPRLGGPIAECYHTSYDPQTGIFALLLDDAAPAEVGNEIRGATIADATLALTELGRLHAPVIGSESLAEAEWLVRAAPLNQALVGQLWSGFANRYGDAITPDQRLVCERLVTGFDAYMADESVPERIKGLVHGDYRLDNMLFGRPGSKRDLTVVDWQTVTWGPAMTDVAYFIGCALTIEDRRAHYDELLRAYHQGLGPDSAITGDQVREGVRRQSFAGVMMAVVSSMLVERTERGDEMFLTMLDRHTSHVLDTGALDILPPPAAVAALTPDPADEGAHQPGDEPLWNESWYWDFADPAQGVGGWLRLGLVPNQNVAWINALVCGPDMPTVALVDFEAPLPADPAVARADGAELRHGAITPLQTYRVEARGTAQEYNDPSALLRGEPGRPVELAIDLTWTTAGTPYAYRITTRYEIPCTVTGTVSIDGRVHQLEAVPGQRDHSHGVRDWWSMDWVWSALHLDDGTHLHGVDLRIPGMDPISVGYIQRAGEPVTETTTVTAEATFSDNGLPLTTTIDYLPGPVQTTVDVRGHAPVRLVAPEGQVSFFPRAWVTVETADGRTGSGWVEWNRNL
ncbi:phosphotransferase [Mycobacterium crocinum]|uniref:Ecdysteroid 22-kinase family protein n=1 Tax=Mycolicibacterium crocinum TaxID=388459 RepID=A0ABY3TCF4_9MYCO|nr:ecdysteroid 22-kinase family protein [Mycolicibacterium crocinum]MCV7215143.1 phosphotransferase [Mycolicibacterium crocinum]ULN39107.1 ecdysteroid 22-kinase family protein [Mycolicibacterium crocinum]